MDKKFVTALKVNDAQIELNRFAGQFLTQTVLGAVSSLKGGEDIHDLELLLEAGNVKLVVNGDELPLTPFPEEIITNTITGLVSSLKGVSQMDIVKINVTAQ